VSNPIGRRRFLQLGGTAAASAVLLACTKDDPSREVAPGPSTTTTLPALPADPVDRVKTDLAVTLTLASLEVLAADTYSKLAASGLVTDVTLATTLALFARHHRDHLTALNLAIADADGAPVDQPNSTFDQTVVQPAVAAATTQGDVIAIALTLEGTLAQTYVYGVNAATTPARRSQLLSVAGVETRHRAVVANQLRPNDLGYLLPSAFAPDDNPLPPDALVVP
jgi:hypothetical protein